MEQKEGVAQVNKAVQEMDTLTQENAALVETWYPSFLNCSHLSAAVLILFYVFNYSSFSV